MRRWARAVAAAPTRTVAPRALAAPKPTGNLACGSRKVRKPSVYTHASRFMSCGPCFEPMSKVRIVAQAARQAARRALGPTATRAARCAILGCHPQTTTFHRARRTRQTPTLIFTRRGDPPATHPRPILAGVRHFLLPLVRTSSDPGLHVPQWLEGPVRSIKAQASPFSPRTVSPNKGTRAVRYSSRGQLWRHGREGRALKWRGASDSTTVLPCPHLPP